MSTTDEIVHDAPLSIEIHRLGGSAFALDLGRYGYHEFADVQGLAALIAPPALLAPEPEPSEREIEAGAKALWGWSGWGDDIAAWADRPSNIKSAYRERAQVVLAAARAARQTGGEA